MQSPLTYGQLSVIRALQRLPVETWSQTYLPKIMRVPTGRTEREVITALDTLSRRHESLRTHFIDVSTEPKSVTMPSGVLDVDVVELPGCDYVAAAAIAQDRSTRRFRWDTEFAWRSMIITDGGLPTHVVIVVDHLAADAWALRRLRAELRALLGEPDLDGARWLNETPPQPRELARIQRSPAWQARRRATDRYWDGLLRELAPTSFPWPTVADRAGRIEAILHSRGARFLLGRAAHRLDTSPQTILLALTAVAAATAFEADQIVLTLQASNRFERRWRDIVTSMNQATPLPVVLPHASTSFTTFAKQVHSTSLHAYRHGCYDLDQMRAKVRETRGVPLNFDCYFNFLANDVLPHDATPPADLEPSVYLPTSPHRQVGPRFDVKVRGGADMPLVVRVDPRLIGEQELRRLLLWYEDEITRLSAGEHVSIGDLRARRTRS